MKHTISKLSLWVVLILALLVFCSCSVTIDIAGTKYNITFHNTVGFSVRVNMNGGTSYVTISPGSSLTLNLEEGTQLSFCDHGDPLTKFVIDDLIGDYIFVLDGAGYTLHAETGCLNPLSVRVTRVL